MGATGPHFSESELACPCCGVNGVKPEGIALFEDVRRLAEDHFGMGRVSMNVSSGYRCEAHNAKVGGESKSQHMAGLAIDFQMQIGQDRGKGKTEWVSVQPSIVEQIARRSKLLGGIGRASTFLHIDARPRATAMPAQWAYDASGKACAYFKAV
jgi:uncharacterized protein YcbK (DUF882 family)